MLQTNIRERYRITTLEVIELIEDLISYSSSIVSNRSTALITDKFSVALLTKPAILNNANIALVDAMHYSVIDTLTITLIKDDDDLLGTVNSYIKPPLKRCKTEAADSRHAKASRERTKKDKDLEDSNTSSDVLRLRRRDRAAARAQLAKRKQLGKKAQLKKTRDEEELAKAKKEKEEKEAQERETYSLDINSKDNSEDEEATIAKDLAREQKERLKALLNANLSARVETAIEHYAYILYFKELLSNNSRIFANAIGIGKTRAITEVQNAQAEGNATEHNAVNNNDKLCPTKGKRTFYCANPLALQFCFFSNSPPENIGRLTKEKAIEMQINTTNAISKALAAANKLFIIVCGFRKIDKHIFRAYNTISRDSVTSNRIYKIEDARNIIANIKHDASEYKSSYKDILEKEGLNKSEASRRVIFNCFKMQAIASYSALATLKAAHVKDLFTNLSKDYFLVQEARAITKSSLNIAAEDAAKAANTLLLLKKVRAKILIESYKPIMQAIIVALIAFAEAIILTEATHVLAEIYVSIVYFNLDSKLELKVLGKQDVKTTS
ncbi:hypothetical protein HBI59_119390 [Parastagonospora nodorum]|nr:hypothetical protein HBI59_119390 [Parastagonospora nodorum]